MTGCYELLLVDKKILIRTNNNLIPIIFLLKCYKNIMNEAHFFKKKKSNI